IVPPSDSTAISGSSGICAYVLPCCAVPAAAGAPMEKGPLRAVGQPLLRREDDRLLRGTAQFVDDVHLPGTVHATFLRSAVAHARILGVDGTAAAAAPGVSAVISASELELGPLLPPVENPDA